MSQHFDIGLNSINYKYITKAKGNCSNFISAMIFLIPLCYLGSGTLFTLLKMMLFIPCFYNVYNKNPKVNKKSFLFLIFISLMILFVYNSRKLYAIPSALYLALFYIMSYKRNYSNNEWVIFIERLSKGCLFAGLLGFFYMIINNNFIRGGELTENSLGISNLTVPLFLSVGVIWLIYDIRIRRSNIVKKIIVILVLLGIVFFLGKRGPLLFCILSVLISTIISSTILKKITLLLLFAFPLYEIPLLLEVQNNFEIIKAIFNRADDLENVENNPRIYRVLVAEQFISDFQYKDLITYHEKLQISEFEDDEAHNHFHNTLLQLYYERGLISVVILFIILLKIRWRSLNENEVSSYSFIFLLFFLFVGTSEDMLMTGSPQELLFMFYLFLATK